MKAMPNKKSLVYLAIVLIVAVAFTAFLYVRIKKSQETSFIPLISEQNVEQKKITKQLRELDELRQQAGPTTFSQEDTENQIKELDKLRHQSQ